MQTIYRPGQWYLIVIPGALVALPPDVPGEAVAGLWNRLPGERSLATVIDVLSAHAGGSFADMPPFLAVVLDGADARLALRGRVVARVTGAAGEAEMFSGAEVTTWSERFVGGATRVEITVQETASGTAFPVQSGIVLAAAVNADLEAGDAESAAVPELSAETPPAPALPREEGTAVGDAVSPPPASVIPPPPVPPVPVPSVPSAAPIASVPVSAPDAPADAAAPVDAAAPADAPAPAVDTDSDGPAAASETPAQDEPDAAAEAGVEDATLVPTDATFAPVADEFDHLWGATVHTPIEDAAVRPPAEPEHAPAEPLAPAPAAPGSGDHDGATISAAELRALRQQTPAAADETPTAVFPVAEVAASSGRIRMSTGQVVALDRTVIIGRRPRSTRASGANLPHLIAVESPQQDISRSHLEIRPEGDTVVVIDLHTTNGSTLLRPGADPVRLHPGEQTLVLSGDVVDLGDGVTVAFEDLP